MSDETFDYIVVGAGSAGAVIASRLVSRGAGSVLLLEAGGRDRSLFFHMPAAVSRVIPTKTWPYTSQPEAATNNRVFSLAQGRVLGGSSSVNGMIYIRGQKEDYDAWERDFGCTGWNAREMLHYFRKSEANETLSGEYHGTEGLQPVSENRYRHPLSAAFVRAGQEYGLPYVTDFNGASQLGVGFYQTTTHRGARASTAQGYLKAARGNRNLEIRTDALVERIRMRDRRAVAVDYSQAGVARTAHARLEIIVAAGGLGSPKILMLSGIGPADHLKSVGIAPLADLPVGENLQEHPHMSLNASTRLPVSLYGQDRGWRALLNGLQWLVYRSGPVTSNILEAAVFADTANTGRPDVQVNFLPILDTWDDPDGPGKGRTHGLTLKAGHLQPRARGKLLLGSANPADLPKIFANFLGHEDDLAGQMRAVRLGLRLLEMPSLKSQIAEVFSPAPADIASDAGLEAFIRGNIKTGYHPVGTCAMGPDPRNSVVDPALRVHGIDGLRVADCSVFPQIPSGNTNAPTIALAEKAVDIICGNK